MTPEEYKIARARVQQRTMRAVKRTLIVFAALAAAYYLFLLKTSTKETPNESGAIPSTVVVKNTNATPDGSNVANNAETNDLGSKEKE